MAASVVRKPLNVLALLPIITPPFVVGLGLILLFGRAGLANQFLEWAFGIPATRWFYGLFGIWLAQMFAFTPIAFLIMRGVVQGVAPSLEEAAQTLRASRWRTFTTVNLGSLRFAPLRPVTPGPVRVAVRPEAWQVAAVAVSAGLSSDAPEDALPGTLRKMAYLGSFLELTVDTPLGEVFVVSPEVDHPWQLGDALLLRLGSHGVSVVAG